MGGGGEDSLGDKRSEAPITRNGKKNKRKVTLLIIETHESKDNSDQPSSPITHKEIHNN